MQSRPPLINWLVLLGALAGAARLAEAALREEAERISALTTEERLVVARAVRSALPPSAAIRVLNVLYWLGRSSEGDDA